MLDVGLKHPDKVYRLSVYGYVFKLIDVMAIKKVPDTPVLFKLLI
jgi:hypothetical protein